MTIDHCDCGRHQTEPCALCENIRTHHDDLMDHRTSIGSASPNGHPGTEIAALRQIWEIVHTPSRATNHKGARDHFMADFDAIRKIIKPLIQASRGNAA